MLSVPSAAIAASSTCQAYSSQTCTTTIIPTKTTTGTLPFTGMNIGLLLLGAGGLIGAGFGVRRLSSSSR